MVAQDPSEGIVCPKCFAPLKAGTEFCPECGASIARGSEGSDTEVYQELSRANLLRMRGNSKEAIDVCLGILRRFPNNVTSHDLLGDIYAENGDLKQAAEWYEMAIDLAPDSELERSKLAKVRERITEKESAQTVKQLGIPEKADNSKTWGWLMAGGILVVGALAFFIGRAMNGSPVNKAARIESPVTIPNNVVNDSAPPVSGDPPPTRVVTDDTELAKLKSSAPFAADIVSLQVDPRGPDLMITVKAPFGSDTKALATQISQHVFSSFGNLRKLTVRLITQGNFVLLADIDRAKFDAANGGEDIFSNLWQIPVDTPEKPTTAEDNPAGNGAQTQPVEPNQSPDASSN